MIFSLILRLYSILSTCNEDGLDFKLHSKQCNQLQNLSLYLYFIEVETNHRRGFYFNSIIYAIILQTKTLKARYSINVHYVHAQVTFYIFHYLLNLLLGNKLWCIEIFFPQFKDIFFVGKYKMHIKFTKSCTTGVLLKS